jgi:diguanylate cyclase (GGDEF)-like protein/PAS domain S-box-containing protein
MVQLSIAVGMATAATAQDLIKCLVALGLSTLLQLDMLWVALAVLTLFTAGTWTFFHLYQRAESRNCARRKEPAMGELEMLRTVVANLPDLIYVKDRQSRFLMANHGVVELMGVQSSNDLLGKTDFDFFPKELAARFYADERRVLITGQTLMNREEQVREPGAKIRWMLTTKVPFFDAFGDATGVIGIGRNITALKQVEAELRQAREELEFKASHDSLMPLLNRGAILDMLERELARSVREDSSTAVLLGDLDHFKNINDLHGHPIGDAVLLEVSNRLLKTVRPYDMVGRYGGEEFLVVLPGCAASDALARANQLRQAIAATPILTTHGPLLMTISIGVLVAQDWGKPTTAEILREVDAALYDAKAAGRNCCKLAQPGASISGPPVGCESA